MEIIEFDMYLDVYTSYIALIEWLKDEIDIQSPEGLDRIQMVIIGKMLPINSKGYYNE